jgi:hypothetical protein
MEGEIDYDRGLSDEEEEEWKSQQQGMRRRKNGNRNNKECNKKNEIMTVRKLCSLGWVCQNNTISTFGRDMMMEVYGIPGNQ